MAYTSWDEAGPTMPIIHPRPPILQEQDGALIDARWHKDSHKRHIYYDPAMQRVICTWCFSSGYPTCPPGKCLACKTTNWYERTIERGGGWACATCGGDIEVLLALDALEKTA